MKSDLLRNYGPELAPLVTVLVAAYDRDIHLLPRALRSLEKQTLPKSEMEVIICYDGDPTRPEISNALDAACADLELDVKALGLPSATGYYTMPRNMGTIHAQGLYIACLDADNEFAPAHLENLIEAIRTAGPDREGWPHFVYSRRTYVKDEGAADHLPVGPTALVPWTPASARALGVGPTNNFIDTGDLLIGKATLYELAERTGYMWKPGAMRFGDWDLAARLASSGLRGRAIDCATNIYHWTGANLQVTRSIGDVIALPEDAYRDAVNRGMIRQ